MGSREFFFFSICVLLYIIDFIEQQSGAFVQQRDIDLQMIAQLLLGLG